MAMAAMVSGGVSVSSSVSVSGHAFDGRAAALSLCNRARGIVPSSRCRVGCWEVVRSSGNGVVGELFVDNDDVALVTRNALQVPNVGKGATSAHSSLALLSAFEGRSMKKGDEVTQESVQRSLEGTSIFFMGMMACGKLTVGRTVVNALNYKFFDSDDVIESYVDGLLVKEIFREVEFRDLEVHLVLRPSAS